MASSRVSGLPLLCPGFLLKTVAAVAVANALHKVEEKEAQQAISSELTDMTKFVPYPGFISQEGRPVGIPEVDTAAQGDRHTAGMQRPRGEPGHPSVFVDS